MLPRNTSVVVEEATKKRRLNRFSPVVDNNWIVKLLRLHAFINLFRTLKSKIIMKDLFNLRDSYHPEAIDTMYKQAIQRPVPQWNCIQRHQLLYIIVFRVVFWELLLIAVLAILTSGLSYAGPLFIKQIMLFIKNPEPTSESERQALMFAGVWMLIYFFRIMLNEHTLWRCFAVSLKMEQLMNLIVYDKTIKMSGLARQYLDEGDLLTYFILDTRKIVNFFRSFSVLFSAPTTLIMAQVFVYTETGVYGASLSGIIALELIALIILSRFIAKNGLLKLQQFNRRLTYNVEVMTQFKQLKALGWQEHIAMKNRELRQPENIFNKRAYVLTTLYNFLVSFSPPMVLLIIFLLDHSTKDQAFSTTHVYTLITYINLITGPLSSLPQVLVSSVELFASTRRIDHLLTSLDAKKVETYALECGGVWIKHLVGRWNDEACRQHFQSGDREFNKKKNSTNTRILPKITQQNIEGMPTQRSFAQDNHEEVVLTVPFDIRLEPGERLIVLGQIGVAKYNLAQAFLGHLNVTKGSIHYGGKIGYMPQVPFLLRRQTIRENVLFGEPLEEARLNKIYSMTRLSQLIEPLSKGDSTLLEDISVLLSPSFRQKLALARAIYYNPDIYIFDNLIDEVDMESLSTTFRIFQKEVKGRTIIIMSCSRDLIQPTDKILVFNGTTAVEYGRLSELSKNPQSYINFWEHRKQLIMAKIHRHPDLFQQNKQPTSEQVRIHIAEKDLCMSRQVGPDSGLPTNIPQSASMKPQLEPKEPKKQLDNNVRPPKVPLSIYLKLLQSGSVPMYLLGFVFTVLGQALNIFSYWWVGAARNPSYNFTSTQITSVYIGTVLGYGLLLFLSTIILPFMSFRSTEIISDEIINTFSTIDLTWIQKQSKTTSASLMGRDNQEYFIINTTLQSVVSNVCFYLGTFILSGYANPMFFIVGVSAVIINLFTTFAYGMAQRQLYLLFILSWRRYNTVTQDNIEGVNTIMSMNKAEYFRKRLMDSLYWMTVCRANQRWAIQGLSMVCDLTGLISSFSTSAFSISSRSQNHPRINIIGTAISMSSRLINLSSKIAREFSSTQTQIRITIRNPLAYAGNNQEKGYHGSPPPPGWPFDHSIRLESVSHQHEEFSRLSLNKLSLQLPSKSKVAFYDAAGDTTVQTLFMLLTKLKHSSSSCEINAGKIYVGGAPIDSIGRKYLKQVVAMIDDIPFIFTGTLRENIDPFNQYSDALIVEALRKIGLWDQLPFNNPAQQLKEKLHVSIQQQTAAISLGHRQLINMVRMYIRQPKILLCSYSGSAVSLIQRYMIRNMTFNDFKDSTMLLSSQDMLSLIECDVLVGLKEGKISQSGEPHKLFYKLDSHYRSLVKELDRRLFYYLENDRRKSMRQVGNQSGEERELCPL